MPAERARGGRSRFAIGTLIGALFALLLACAAPVAAQPTQVDASGPVPRVGLATMQPGEIFFERFGHNAIVVAYPGREPLSYNFGMFDMGEDGFVARFVRGEMIYRLAELQWREDLQYYLDTGRGVRIQWLDLDDARAVALAAALAENARPENARYRYDYFADNCATRVRDALDRALDGELRRQLGARSQGNTYRSEAVRLASPAPWMWLGFDLGLSQSADRPLSHWEDAYVPMRLAASLRDVRLADGRPLVRSEQQVAPHRIAPEPPETPRPWWPWLFAGMLAAVLWAMLHARAPRAAAAGALLFWALAGLLGAVMLGLWLGTEHRFAWANRNLFLLNPLAWLLLPGAWRLLRGRDAGRVFRFALAVVATVAVLALFVLWLPRVPQANAHWVSLLLPIHLAFGWVWLRPAESR